MKSILAASSDLKACEAIRQYFESDYHVVLADSRESCLSKFRKKRHEYTFIDVEFLVAPGHEGGRHDFRAGIEPFRRAFPTAEIIVLADQPTIREAVRAVKAGASDYLTLPIVTDELRHVVEGIMESIRLRTELNHFRNGHNDVEAQQILLSKNPLVREVVNKALSAAPTDSTILLTGETGTGKSLLARLIHLHSRRRNEPFIHVHCGTIPDPLLESELFGHEKGAFTGADRRRFGKFEVANGGTLFLDEIGTISQSAQVKLLKVLQFKTYQRVGGDVDIESDTRIIAATNADLDRLCQDGLIRKDLYYRLSVFPIESVPLRDRVEDIPMFVSFFLDKMNKLHGKQITSIHPGVMDAFNRYGWPGNIRELENLMERAYILETSPMLMLERFPAELFPNLSAGTVGNGITLLSLAQARRRSVESTELRYLQDLLRKQEGRIQKTADAAGITSRQLNKLMQKYRIRKEDFKR